MRVLLVAHHLPPRHVAGTEVYTLRLATELARRHAVTVFATDDDPRLRPGSVLRRQGAGFDIAEMAEPRLVATPEESWSSPRAEETFRKLVAEARPDVCHFQHLRFLSLALPAIARAAGVATVMTVNDYWLLCARDGQLVDREGRLCSGPGPEKCADCLRDYRFGLTAGEVRVSRAVARLRDVTGLDLARFARFARRAGLAIRRVARKSVRGRALSQTGAAGMLDRVEARRTAVRSVSGAVDLFIAPSEYLRGVFRDAGFAGGRWAVVGYGMDGPDRERPAARPGGSGPLRIGFAGTVTPPKGVDILIQAVQTLPPGSFSLDIHGRDDLRPEYALPLKKQARGLPIRFHGAFEPAAAAGFVPGWDVAVVPSRWVENQPLAILESLAYGVPVVAADLGGMRELVKDGVNGRLFEAGSPASLAAVLGELASDKSRVEALRGGVVPPPTMEAHARVIEALYEEARDRG